MRLPPSITILVTTTVLSACGSTASESPGAAVVRDSGGVAIVENFLPRWRDEQAWLLDTIPRVALGDTEADDQRQFHQVSDVRQLSDGRLVVANAGTNELRFFSPQGEYLCTSGRTGRGPGEFESLGWLALIPGDTVLAYSSGAGGRLSVIAPDGRFVRTAPIPRASGFAGPVGVLPSGAFLLRSYTPYTMKVTSGTHRDSVTLALALPPDSVLARIGPFPGQERTVLRTGDNMTVTSLIFGRGLLTAIGSGGIYVGVNDRWSISQFDEKGRLRRSIRMDRVPEPLTTELIAHAESVRLANARQGVWGDRTRALIGQMRYPDRLPAYDGILVDALGDLWVSRYAALPGAREWDVIDSAGVLLGAVTLPTGFFPKHIGDTAVVGVAYDDDNMEFVRLYRLSRTRKDGFDRGAAPAPDEVQASAKHRACGS